MAGKKIKVILLLLVGFVLLGYSKVIFAETIPDRPPLNGIYDPHHYLSKEVSDKLSSMNWEYSRTEAKPQIAIAIVDSLDGDLETVANNVARNWQVGFSDTNYGMLVLISVKERKIRTEVSNNMGAIIPDSTAQELNDSIKDDFRNENYSSGMLKYLSKVEAIISSSPLEKEESISQNLEGVSPNLGEQIRNSQKEQKSYVKKYGLIGAIIFGISILILIFIGVKCDKLRKEEEEYYKWKKGKSSSCSGFVSNSYHSTSGSYDSFSSPHSSSSYDSSGSSSSSWSGGGFDGGGSSGSW